MGRLSSSNCAAPAPIRRCYRALHACFLAHYFAGTVGACQTGVFLEVTWNQYPAVFRACLIHLRSGRRRILNAILVAIGRAAICLYLRAAAVPFWV